MKYFLLLLSCVSLIGCGKLQAQDSTISYPVSILRDENVVENTISSYFSFYMTKYGLEAELGVDIPLLSNYRNNHTLTPYIRYLHDESLSVLGIDYSFRQELTPNSSYSIGSGISYSPVFGLKEGLSSLSFSASYMAYITENWAMTSGVRVAVSSFHEQRSPFLAVCYSLESLYHLNEYLNLDAGCYLSKIAHIPLFTNYKLGLTFHV